MSDQQQIVKVRRRFCEWWIDITTQGHEPVDTWGPYRTYESVVSTSDLLLADPAYCKEI